MTTHELRHGFSSICNSLGYSRYMTDEAIGKKNLSSTSNYIHAILEEVVKLSNTISINIQAAMEGKDHNQEKVAKLYV